MIRSTVPDLAQFLIAQLNHGRNGEFTLLQPETVILMHTKSRNWSAYQTPLRIDLYDYNINSKGYGLGWEQFTDGFEGHGGSVPGFMALMYGKQTKKGPFGVILLISVNIMHYLQMEVN